MISSDIIENLIHRCSIEDHPIKQLPEDIQVQYVRGLNYLIKTYGLRNENFNHSYLGILLKSWCESILSDTKDINGTTIEDARKALSLHRIGWKFFRLKRDLFFDFFYILNSCSGENSEQIVYPIYEAVKKDIAGIFTRKALTEIYNFFYPIQGMPETPESKLPQTQLQCYLEDIDVKERKTFRILFVANVSAGKSTLINALVGYDINEARTTACTNRLNYIFNKPYGKEMTFIRDEKNIRYEICDGEEEDATFKYSAIPFYSFFLDEYKICLIDTPGINNAEDLSHGRITEEAIKKNEYDLVVYVSNCQYFGTDDEKSILTKLIKDCKSPIIFCLNQLDTFKQKEDSIEKMLKDYKGDLKKLGVKEPIVVPVSAEAGLLLKFHIMSLFNQECSDFLDEDTLFDIEKYKKKFSKDYFNLPNYSELPKDYDLDLDNSGWTEDIKSDIITLEKTGIHLLESTIINTISNTEI